MGKVKESKDNKINQSVAKISVNQTIFDNCFDFFVLYNNQTHMASANSVSGTTEKRHHFDSDAKVSFVNIFLTILGKQVSSSLGWVGWVSMSYMINPL